MTSYKPHEIEWTAERVAHLWNFYSSTPSHDVTYFSMHSGRSILKAVRRHLSLQGRQVLDFGCGRGHMLRYMLEDGIPCQGLEFSHQSVIEARQHIGDHPLFGGVVHAEGVPTPLADACVDVVLILEVIEHLFEDQLLPTLRDIHRVLRPGGHIVATTPHAEDLSSWQTRVHCPECGSTFHRWQHMRSVTVASMSALMMEAGFRRLICQPTHFRAVTGGRFDYFVIARLKRWYQRLRGWPVAWPHLIYIGQKRPTGSET